MSSICTESLSDKTIAEEQNNDSTLLQFKEDTLLELEYLPILFVYSTCLCDLKKGYYLPYFPPSLRKKK